ncbi:glycosyltransferase [Flexibacterium corallicola]|uniref:glycosyltransferase n=1 Tax=Flexibacterium corallicola TaxID=3037259 RepID=UPI00286EBCDE|nr:glycosyltransferase [Pseudovibrio sp. M1P-2-3]
MLVTDYFVIAFLVTQALFLLAAYIFAFSGVDDLFVDIFYYIRCAGTIGPWANINEMDLLKKLGTPEELPMAIMIPAWDEADIIRPSVSRIINVLTYSEYDIFIGVYPNDLETQSEVEHLRLKHKNVHRVITSSSGPTCKADCLNDIVSHIFDYEKKTGKLYHGFIMQDAEDIIQPNCLHLFNAALTKYDAVQLPVLSLPRTNKSPTAGHYMDEFAEYHSKEVLVRSIITGTVAGAGVGTGYSRRTLEKAVEIQGSTFNVGTLTEDYDLAMRLHRQKVNHTFLWVKSKETSDYSPFHVTQEFFPSDLWQSIRQKTRWTIGIGFQGWQQLGWKGNLADKYFFWRDRKMIFFSHAIFVGYLAMFLYGALWLYHILFPFGYQIPALLDENSPFWIIIWFNIFLFFHRLIQRHIWTGYHYGWKYLPPVTYRYILSIIINYVAMCRATITWLKHRINKKVIGWDKTAHDFPDEYNDQGRAKL